MDLRKISSVDADRRQFLGATSSAFLALMASGGCTTPYPKKSGQKLSTAVYGELRADPAGVLDLPSGFSYRVISRLGDKMDDGLTVPNAADGMGCFDIGNGELALVRNHELDPYDGADAGGDITQGYGRDIDGAVLPGGTTNIVLDAKTLAVKRQFRTLAGTIRNCAGGTTPWGSWLTCEEPLGGWLRKAGPENGKKMLADHGYLFEIPANATGMVDAVPLKAMGCFNHEAAAVDPATGIVYMTEDWSQSLLYRFIPNVPGKLAQGGKLQALAIDGIAVTDNKESAAMAVGKHYAARWVDLPDPDLPLKIPANWDDTGALARAGRLAGASYFRRGEGIHMGDEELYFCCTSGGAAGLGQVFRLKPGRNGNDTIELFFESTSSDQFDTGDNLVVAPNGHLIVCEDQYADVVKNHLRGITPQGEAYDFAFLRLQTELAGACFSPDGKTMFVNIFAPAMTVAITGPWVS